MATLPAAHPLLLAEAKAEPHVVLVGRCPDASFEQRVYIGPHLLVADELPEAGGDDRGPDPFQLLQAALGACTSMTLGVYAKRKGWELGEVTVRVGRRVEEETGADGRAAGKVQVFERRIALGPHLGQEQRERLLQIANQCPVHKALTGLVRIESELDPV